LKGVMEALKIGVVIPAAGQGKRMGTKKSKQFLMLEKKPVFIHTLLVFENYPAVSEIVVVTRKEEISEVERLIEEYGIQKVTHVIEGGRERQDSVYEGLKYLHTDWVMVHDAVRPFVTTSALDRLLQIIPNGRAAILAVPVKDTIKQVDQDGIVEQSLDRSKLWAVQTPQLFERKLLWEAHQLAKEKNLMVTDDAMMVEQLGITVQVVLGEYNNIKLTTPEDLILAEAICKAR
jgi:2-C-methyl-D-erythritol 4-phosphate cytidylyltransferase